MVTGRHTDGQNNYSVPAAHACIHGVLNITCTIILLNFLAVKPVNLTCDGDIKEDHILISDCISNNKIMTMECTINDAPKKDCMLGIIILINTLYVVVTENELYYMSSGMV